MTKELETEARNRSTTHRWVDTFLDSAVPVLSIVGPDPEQDPDLSPPSVVDPISC
jgi:hypothetical protein